MSAVCSYKTHLLVAFPQYGEKAEVVGRWEYVPTGPEIQAALKAASTSFKGFVLVAPVGDTYPGNFAAPEPDYGYCG